MQQERIPPRDGRAPQATDTVYSVGNTPFIRATGEPGDVPMSRKRQREPRRQHDTGYQLTFGQRQPQRGYNGFSSLPNTLQHQAPPTRVRNGYQGPVNEPNYRPTQENIQSSRHYELNPPRISPTNVDRNIGQTLNQNGAIYSRGNEPNVNDIACNEQEGQHRREIRSESRNPRSVRFCESRCQSHYAPEITFDRENNQANTHEQQALRRWVRNKYYDGVTIDKNYASTDEFMSAIHCYQNSQHVHDSVILRNVAQSFTGEAST